MDDAQVTVVGRLATRPELPRTKDEAFVVTFRVAQTQRRRDAETGEWHDGNTSFFQVYCYRQVAAQVHASLTTGDPVIVQGRLQVENWDNGQRSGQDVIIQANSVGANLHWDHIHVDRSRRRRKDDRHDAEASDHDADGQASHDEAGEPAEEDVPPGVDAQTGELLDAEPLAG